MRIIYLPFDRYIQIEKVRAIRQQLIEMPDGYHPFTADAIWHHARRRLEPIIMIAQSRLEPFGSRYSKKQAYILLFELEGKERALKTPSVSKMWIRKLFAFFDWFASKGIVYVILGMVGIIVLASLLGGG